MPLTVIFPSKIESPKNLGSPLNVEIPLKVEMPFIVINELAITWPSKVAIDVESNPTFPSKVEIPIKVVNPLKDTFSLKIVSVYTSKPAVARVVPKPTLPAVTSSTVLSSEKFSIPIFISVSLPDRNVLRAIFLY